MSDEVVQTTGLKPKTSVKFTLHVHLDDGSVKTIECVGSPIEPTKEEVTPNDNRSV